MNGQFRPVAFVSCPWLLLRKKLLPNRKEAFSIIFGLKQFHQYLDGRSFIILTENQPLLSPFGPKNPVPAHATARLQRWTLILASYNYNIEYRSTSAHADAEAFRVFLYLRPGLQNVKMLISLSQKLWSLWPVRWSWGRLEWILFYPKYTVLSLAGGQKWWILPLHQLRANAKELTTQQGCILWGTRLVVPTSLQEKVLQELHDTHPGISRMKAWTRCYVWWPNIDSHIGLVAWYWLSHQENCFFPQHLPVHEVCFSYSSYSSLDFPSTAMVPHAGPISGWMAKWYDVTCGQTGEIVFYS